MRRTFLASTLALSLLAAAASALASGIPAGRYAIGDSVMLGAKPQLQAHGFVVDAVKSRQFYQAVSIVKRKKAHGLLRQKIVIHLGTNGVLIRAGDCDKIARLAGAARLPRDRDGSDQPSRDHEGPEHAAARVRPTPRQHVSDRLVQALARSRELVLRQDASDAEGPEGLRVVPVSQELLVGRGGSVDSCPVACPSGRRDTPGKRVEGKLSRGFESLGHRQAR